MQPLPFACTQLATENSLNFAHCIAKLPILIFVAHANLYLSVGTL